MSITPGLRKLWFFRIYPSWSLEVIEVTKSGLVWFWFNFWGFLCISLGFLYLSWFCRFVLSVP